MIRVDLAWLRGLYRKPRASGDDPRVYSIDPYTEA